MRRVTARVTSGLHADARAFATAVIDEIPPQRVETINRYARPAFRVHVALPDVA